MDRKWKGIDIGVNLFCSQFEGREEEIAEASAAQGIGLVITGADPESSALGAAFAQKHADVFATAGIHPHDADAHVRTGAEKIRSLLSGQSVVAVGECGLDYDRMYSARENQQSLFEDQLCLAEEAGLPLFLHERAAHRDLCDHLRAHPAAASRAVVHCFTGTRQEADAYLALGCHIGITGWLLDERRNESLLDALAIIPLERLMVETDAPYLLPRGCRLKNPNLPVYLPYITGRLAQIRGLDPEELSEILLRNTCAFFGIRLS